MDTNWDIDQYQNKFEPLEHWDLKKEFLQAHKSLIAEEQLVCLAQVYVNMELLGCCYPQDVARQVKELGKGLGQKYQNSRQDKLQRTFVKASYAAQAKVRKYDPVHSKKRKREDSDLKSSSLENNYFTACQRSDAALVNDMTQDLVSNQKVAKKIKEEYASGIQTGSYFHEVQASFSLTQPDASPAMFESDFVHNPQNQSKVNLQRGNYFQEFQIRCSQAMETDTQSRVTAKDFFHDPKTGTQNSMQDASGDNGKQMNFPDFQTLNSLSEIPCKKLKDIQKLWSSQNPLQKVILVHQLNENQNFTHTALVRRFVKLSGMSYKLYFDKESGNLTAFIDGIEVGSLVCDNMEDGRNLVSELVLETLCGLCCLLEIKNDHHDINYATAVSASDAGIGSADQEEMVTNDDSTSSGNIGNKLLKMMGWTGGGLGKDGTGRAEPVVEPGMITGRQGLGYSGPADGGACTHQFKGKIHQLLQKFVAEVEAGIASSDELMFSPNFSKGQRAFIHQAARRYWLKSLSYGTGSDRYLVLSLKMNNRQKVINVLKRGGETDLFTIHMPGTYDIGIFNLVAYSKKKNRNVADMKSCLQKINVFPELHTSFFLTQPDTSTAMIKGESVHKPSKQTKVKILQESDCPGYLAINSYATADATNLKLTTEDFGQCDSASGDKQNLDSFPDFPTFCNCYEEKTFQSEISIQLKYLKKFVKSTNPLQNIILLHRRYGKEKKGNKAYRVIKESVELSDMTYKVEFDKCSGNAVAYIDSMEVGSVACDTIKEGRKQVSKVVLETFCRLCCLLQIKTPHHDIRDISRSCEQSISTSDMSSTETSANKLLKMMSGVGLRKDGRGIAEPDEHASMTSSQGLGFSKSKNINPADSSAKFKTKVQELLQNCVSEIEASSTHTEKLVFPSSVSDKERIIIKQVARKCRLNTSCYGTLPHRYLVVGLSTVNFKNFNYVVRQGGKSGIYTSHMPGTYDISIFRLM